VIRNAWPSEAGADVCVVHLKHEASESKTAAKWWCRLAHCLTARTTTRSSSSLDTVSLTHVGMARHQHTHLDKNTTGKQCGSSRDSLGSDGSGDRVV
jgi:hypothetical protein